MSSHESKPPPAPDPNTIIPLENQYNRWNSSGPFGSQTWSSDGAGGHETLNTSLSPQMQGAMDRAFSASQTPYQQLQTPQGVNQLASAILGKVGSHYGLQAGGVGANGLNTNMQQKQSPQQMQQPQGMPQMQGMQGMPSLSGPQQMPAMSMQPGFQAQGSPGGSTMPLNRMMGG